MSNHHLQHMHIAGEFDVDVRTVNADGSEGPLRRLITNGKNLITNTGMDYFGGTGTFGGFMAFVQVGTSNTTPAYTDTALGARVASQGSLGGSVNSSWDTADPKKAVLSTTFTFATGAAAGVLAELGLSNTSTGQVFTRALFVDSGGNPVTVTVLSDEQLIITYRLVFTVNETDSTLVTTQKGTEYTLTLRPARLGAEFAGGIQYSNRLSAFISNYSLGPVQLSQYSGATSAIRLTTQEPLGTKATVISNGNPAAVYGTYTAGNYFRDDQLTIPLAAGNTAGVGAWMVYGMPFLTQVGISPRVTKTSTDTIRFTIRTAWSRD